MAVVNMKVYETTVRTALNAQFSKVGETYTIELASAEVITPVDVTFASAVYDSVNGYVYVALDSPAYFYVDSGNQIDGLELHGIDRSFYLSASIEARTYTANGTYTISDLIIKVGV
jgi:hypothetical protein